MRKREQRNENRGKEKMEQGKGIMKKEYRKWNRKKGVWKRVQGKENKKKVTKEQGKEIRKYEKKDRENVRRKDLMVIMFKLPLKTLINKIGKERRSKLTNYQ